VSLNTPQEQQEIIKFQQQIILQQQQLQAAYQNFVSQAGIPSYYKYEIHIKDSLSCFMNSLNYNGRIIENRVNIRNMRGHS
jgi:hypothetical protein